MSGPPSPMQQALAVARKAGEQDEVPIGAVIVDGATGQIVASAGNCMEALGDPTAHAEMLALRAALAKTGTGRLDGHDIYVTLEPCPMCAAAISFARIRRVYFGAYDPKSGGVEHGPKVFDHATCHHKPEVVGGVEEEAAASLLKEFFREKR